MRKKQDIVEINLLFLYSEKTYKEFSFLFSSLKKAAEKLNTRLKNIKFSSKEKIDKNSTAFFILNSKEKNTLGQNAIPVFLSEKILISEEKIYFPFPQKKSKDLWAFTLIALCESIVLKKRYKECLKEIEAFDVNSEFSRKELLELRNAVRAQEAVIELGRQEQMRYEEELKAHEKVEEMGRQELIANYEIIKAWEMFYVLVREELLELRKEYEAQQKVLELSSKELEESDKTIKAMDAVAELRRLDEIKEIEVIEKMTEEDLTKILEEEGLWKNLLEKTEKKELVSVIKGLFRLLLRKSKR